MEELVRDLAFEIIYGGDRFDREDVKDLYTNKMNTSELLKLRSDVKDLITEGEFCPQEAYTEDFLENSLNYWICNEDGKVILTDITEF